MTRPDVRHSWPFRHINRRFIHVAGATQRLAWKLDRAAWLYREAATAFSEAVVNRQLRSERCAVRRALETGSVLFNGPEDV